jgi:hypothetical protein
MVVCGDLVTESVSPPDARIDPDVKAMGSACKGRSPRASIMVPNEIYVESSELFFSTSRITTIG